MFRRSTPKGPNHRDAFFEEYRKRDQRRKVSLIVSGFISLLAIGGIFFYDDIARVSSSFTSSSSDSSPTTNWTTEASENPTTASDPITEEETPSFTPQDEGPEQIADNFTPEPVVAEEEDPIVEEPQDLPPPPIEDPVENTPPSITRGESAAPPTELASFDGGEKVYKMADKMPNYPGGLSARKRYIKRNINPSIKASVDNSSRTKVYLQFVVEPTGEITSIRVVQGINQQVNQEAIRLIQEMPRWEPGRIDGERVRVYYTIPIDFKHTS